MSRTKPQWEESLRREVPGGVPHNTGVLVTCECGSTLDVIYPSGRLPPVAIRQKLQRKGWRIQRRTCQCPACWGKVPANSNEEPEAMVSTTVAQDTAIREMNERKAVEEVPLPSERQTPNARKVHRAVMGWLEEAYEEEHKRYKRGFSDISIAEETGAAPQYVAKVREDYFGALGTPPEIEKLTAALDAASRELSELRVATLGKIDKVRTDYIAAAKPISDKVDRLRENLFTLKQENGWK